MRRFVTVISVSALITAIIMIVGEYTGPQLMVYITKPLTMAAILTIALSGIVTKGKSRYGVLIVIGLSFCIVGDMLLMLPPEFFVRGLIAFLIGHIIYIAALNDGIGWQGSYKRGLLFLLYGLIIGAILWPGLGDMRLPVGIYIFVILMMGWRAWERSIIVDTPGARIAVVGALLFILSDTILAMNKFHTPIIAGRALNLSAYFIAQWMIVSSVRIK